MYAFFRAYSIHSQSSCANKKEREKEGERDRDKKNTTGLKYAAVYNIKWKWMVHSIFIKNFFAVFVVGGGASFFFVQFDSKFPSTFHLEPLHISFLQ